MAAIERFEDVRAWQLARELVKAIHRAIRDSAVRGDAELRIQLGRAAVSTMSNVAEGFARGNDGDFLRFLDVARGSAAEVRSLLYVCEDLGYLAPPVREHLHGLAGHCLAAIAGLQTYLRDARAKRT